MRRRISKRRKPPNGPCVASAGASWLERTVAVRNWSRQHNQVLHLERSYGVRPTGAVFPPWDDELELLPGTLTPSLQVQDSVHLGVWMPFGKAAQQLRRFRQTDVSRPTAERVTEAAGAAYVAWQTAEGARIERELPAPPAGPAQLFMSVDGAHIPLVGGDWAEVKTLVPWGRRAAQDRQRRNGDWHDGDIPTFHA